MDWSEVRSPSLEELEALSRVAFEKLPADFRRLCGNIVIRVAEFPDQEALDALGIESEFDLMGLFQGVGLPQLGDIRTGQMPNIVTLYRRPILDYWAENDETLGHLVAHVLVHEIGHHFGLSDEDMEGIEAAQA